MPLATQANLSQEITHSLSIKLPLRTLNTEESWKAATISTSVNYPDCKLEGATQVGEVWKLHIAQAVHHREGNITLPLPPLANDNLAPISSAFQILNTLKRPAKYYKRKKNFQKEK